MPSTYENKEGTLNEFYDSNTGNVKEDGGGGTFDFYHHGAETEFHVDDEITYVKVTTPSGNVIITNIKKKA